MIDRKYQLLLHFPFWGILLAVLGLNTLVLSQTSTSLFGLIDTHPEASVSISFDIDSLNRNKQVETDYPALFTFASAEKNYGTFSCRVSARGNYRKRNCAFPPVKINFVKGDLKDLGLDKYDEYKLVTPCLDDRYAEALLFKELLVYRLFNELTDYSYRVSAFPLVYKDIDSDREISSNAFLIESDNELEDRLDGKWCKCENVPAESFNAFQHELYALFQYMIGNRDMDLSQGHNVKILQRKGDGELVPIPYDFDFSLFVNASYAFPKEEDKVPRIFIGYQENENILKKVFEHFIERKDTLLNVILNFEALSRNDRKECVTYLENFYSDIENKNYQMPYVH